MLTQASSGQVIESTGVKDTSVRLQDFALESLDNLWKQVTGSSDNIGIILFN